MLDSRSITWRLAGDGRFLPFLGRAFLLQVAHPTVAAGVAEHSIFESDPWGRLVGSFGLVLRTIYGQDGDEVGARIRDEHRSIRGVAPDGGSYHAYEPEAYFWVLATGADSIREMASRLGRPLSRVDEERFYAETRELGRRLGLRDRDMPPDLTSFDDWYSEMLRSRIERSGTLERVLAAFARPKPPWRVPRPLWFPLGLLTGHAIGLTSIGTLPAEARDRLGLSWNRRQQAELTALCLALRTAGSLPASLRYLPPARAGFAFAVSSSDHRK
jgi:uncharacterized protein (DUF2236 family)